MGAGEIDDEVPRLELLFLEIKRVCSSEATSVSSGTLQERHGAFFATVDRVEQIDSGETIVVFRCYLGEDLLDRGDAYVSARCVEGDRRRLVSENLDEILRRCVVRRPVKVCQLDSVVRRTQHLELDAQATFARLQGHRLYRRSIVTSREPLNAQISAWYIDGWRDAKSRFGPGQRRNIATVLDHLGRQATVFGEHQLQVDTFHVRQVDDVESVHRRANAARLHEVLGVVGQSKHNELMCPAGRISGHRLSFPVCIPDLERDLDLIRIKPEQRCGYELITAARQLVVPRRNLDRVGLWGGGTCKRRQQPSRTGEQESRVEQRDGDDGHRDGSEHPRHSAQLTSLDVLAEANLGCA